MAVETGQWFDSDGILSCLTGLFSLGLQAVLGCVVFSSFVTERLTGACVWHCSELDRTNFPLDEDVAMMTWPWGGRTIAEWDMGEETGWDMTGAMWDLTGDKAWGTGDIWFRTGDMIIEG